MDYFKQLKIDRNTLDTAQTGFLRYNKSDDGIINKIGISAKPGTKVTINQTEIEDTHTKEDIVFEIGKTGLLEIEGWPITTLQVQYNYGFILNEHILIDYRTNSPDTVLIESKESE